MNHPAMSERIQIEIEDEYIDGTGKTARIVGMHSKIWAAGSDKDDAILELLRHLRHRSRELNAQADAIEAGNYEVVE